MVGIELWEGKKKHENFKIWVYKRDKNIWKKERP